MYRLALVSVISISLFGAALAQKPKKPEPTPKTIKCAVMTDDTVDVAKATKEKMFADYKGRRYFFCCAGCPGAFKKNPEKYKKNASIPTPKAPKKS